MRQKLFFLSPWIGACPEQSGGAGGGRKTNPTAKSPPPLVLPNLGRKMEVEASMTLYFFGHSGLTGISMEWEN